MDHKRRRVVIHVLTGRGRAVGEIGGSRRRMCEQCDGGDSDGVTGEGWRTTMSSKVLLRRSLLSVIGDRGGTPYNSSVMFAILA